MSKHDLQARPIYHHLRESIEAHLSIVVAAMAVSHYMSTKPGAASRNSSAPHAATAPSRSAPADKSSPRPTHYPTTCAKRSPKSADNLNTRMSQLGLYKLSASPRESSTAISGANTARSWTTSRSSMPSSWVSRKRC